jgi:hypothetical protein
LVRSRIFRASISTTPARSTGASARQLEFDQPVLAPRFSRWRRVSLPHDEHWGGNRRPSAAPPVATLPSKNYPSLAEIEGEVLAEGQEWISQRWQQKLQQQAEIGVPFFHQGSHRLVRRRKRRLALRTQVGVVGVETDYGQDPVAVSATGGLEAWGLGPHQKLTPLLQDKLAFKVTATGSYAKAAALSAKWGCPVDDSTLHAWTKSE